MKEEGNILRNLFCNFHNSNIYDAGKDIMSKSVSLAKYIETEQWIGYITLKNVTLGCFLGRKICMKHIFSENNKFDSWFPKN